MQRLAIAAILATLVIEVGTKLALPLALVLDLAFSLAFVLPCLSLCPCAPLPTLFLWPSCPCR